MTEFSVKTHSCFLKNLLDGKNKYKLLYGLWEFFSKFLWWCCDFEVSSGGDDYYVVCSTQRCHFLMQIFLDAVSAFEGVDDSERPLCLRGVDLLLWKRIARQHFITESAFISMSGDLARRGIESRGEGFPHILILSELMAHGRSMNYMLFSVEKTIKAQCRQRGMSDDDTKKITNAFVNSLDIRALMFNNRSSILLRRYGGRMKVENSCKPSTWLNFLSQCLGLIHSYPVNNVAASWGLRGDSLGSEPLELANRGTSLFERIDSEVQETTVSHYIWLFPSSSTHKAVCSVRVKEVRPETDGDACLLIAPTIVYDRLGYDALWRLHQGIVKDLSGVQGAQPALRLITRYDGLLEADPGYGKAIGYRWIAETNNLVLTALLMKVFQREFPLLNDLSVDYEQLSRSFGPSFGGSGEGGSWGVEEALRAIWDWMPDDPDGMLRGYLDDLLRSAAPVGSAASFGSSGCRPVIWDDPDERQAVVFGIENAVSEIAFREERNNYEKFCNSFDYVDDDLSVGKARYSPVDFWNGCQKHLEELCCSKSPGFMPRLSHVIAVTLHTVDGGYLGIGIAPAQSGDGYCTAFHAE